MQIHLNRLREFTHANLLCIAHSDRPLHEPGYELNRLDSRYRSPIRLPPPMPFAALRPSSEHSPYGGSISLYHVGDDGRAAPTLACAFRPEAYKPQFGLWTGDRLWVLGEDRLEAFDAELRPVMTIHDPWLAGGHTIAADGRGNLLVSCSASDSVLTVNLESGAVVRALRMPEDLYGINYPLTRQDSVVDHYIVNDLQLTHVNCAWPFRGGVLVSMLIQGALGWFGPDDRYHELLDGFIGCHGARVRTDADEMFFSDSCTGTIVFLDFRGRILRRVNATSHWLHDAVQIGGDVFAAARFDQNEVLLIDVATRDVVGRIACPAGEAPQFLSFGIQVNTSEAWEPAAHSMQATAERIAVQAALRRQQADMANVHSALVARHHEELHVRDAAIAEMSREIARRDAIIADLSEDHARQVSIRDAIIAEAVEERAREVSRRDAMIADAVEERARELSKRDDIIAALSAEQACEMARRDALLSAQAAEIMARDRVIATLSEKLNQTAGT